MRDITAMSDDELQNQMAAEHNKGRKLGESGWFRVARYVRTLMPAPEIITNAHDPIRDAAPELLEAAKGVMAVLIMMKMHNNYNLSEIMWEDLDSELQAAIDHAEGRNP